MTRDDLYWRVTRGRPMTLREFRHRCIVEMAKACEGNMTHAAFLLGVHWNTVKNHLRSERLREKGEA